MIFPSLPRPHNWAGVRRLGRGAAVVLSTLVVLGSACRAPAQPPGDEGRVSQEQQAAAYRWRELQNQMSAVELTEPEQALAAYQAFYETSGHLYVEVAVGVTSRIAQVYGRNLKNPAKAVELYAWALEQWGDTPYQERLQREAAQMKALLAGAGASKAETSKVVPQGGAVKPGVGVVAVVPVAPVKAIGVPSLGSVPAVVKVPSEVGVPAVVKVPSAAGVPSAVGVAFSIGGSKLAATLGAIEAGNLSAEDAWTRGELSVEQVRALLGQLNPWGKVEGRIGNETRRALALVVVAHEPQLIESPAALTLAQRLWIGEALGDARDGRCVALLESVVEELKRHLPLTTEGEIVSAFIASERLAWFYRDTGQHEKVAQTWMGVPSLLQGAPLGEQRQWMVPDALLGAARGYGALGQGEKAKELYAQIPQYGHGWFTGSAVHDQANRLIKAGQHEVARQLLKKFLAERESESIAVALKTLLAYSYYKTSDFELAKQYSQQAIEQSAITDLGKGLRAALDVARSVSNYSQQWQISPFLVEPPQLYAVVDDQEKITKRFFVRSFRDVPFEVQLTDPNIKVQVAKSASQAEYFVQKEVILEVAPQTLSRSVDAMLIVSNSLQPTFEVRVPIHIEVPAPVRLSSSHLFFGQVSAEATAIRTLTLSASVPFRVLNVGSDSASVTAVFSPEAKTEHQIELSFHSDRSQQFHSGSIRLQTDMLSQPEIQVPFAAHTR